MNLIKSTLTNNNQYSIHDVIRKELKYVGKEKEILETFFKNVGRDNK